MQLIKVYFVKLSISIFNNKKEEKLENKIFNLFLSIEKILIFKIKNFLN